MYAITIHQRHKRTDKIDYIS